MIIFSKFKSYLITLLTLIFVLFIQYGNAKTNNTYNTNSKKLHHNKSFKTNKVALNIIKNLRSKHPLKEFKRKMYKIKNNKIKLAVTASSPLNQNNLMINDIDIKGNIDEKYYLLYSPIDKIDFLSKCEEVVYIYKPSPPMLLANDIKSEGINTANVKSFWTNNYYGAGVNIAVIDLEFDRYFDSVSQGELPGVTTVNFSTNQFNPSGSNVHGTAVAEIVYDIAPGAKMYLIMVEDHIDLDRAVDYCIEKDIDIINYSVGHIALWGWWGYGSDPLDYITEKAYKAGIFWVNAAGNSAKNHYQNHFTDAGGNDYHDFSPGIEYIEFQVSGPTAKYTEIFLNWNDWSSMLDDYDIKITNVSSGFEAQGEYIYNDPKYNVPIKRIETFLNPGVYRLEVSKSFISYSHEFQIMIWSKGQSFISNYSPENSVVSPANSDYVTSVGAINYTNWAAATNNPAAAIIEPYSSRGRLNRIKPDIVAVDYITNYTYPIMFKGTSAAAPHVAGMAALVLSKHEYFTPHELKEYFKLNSIDAGPVGPDNIFGWGLVNMELFPIIPLAEVITNVVLFPTKVKGCENLYFVNLPPDSIISFFDLSGNWVKEYPGPLQPYKTGTYFIKPCDLNLNAGVYIVSIKDKDKNRCKPLKFIYLR